MSNLVKFASAGLPAVSTLADSLRKLETVAPSVQAILKMDKTGHWVFGADQTEVDDDSRWAVNPFSFVHGFIAWGKGEALGEVMAPLTQPLPEVGPAPDGAERGWEMQFGFSLKCISGEDAGLEVRYSTTSVGGKRAVQQLGLAIAEQVTANPSLPVPIITLAKDHYQHKSYGRVYTPVFEVADWTSMDGEAEGVQELDAPEAAAAEGEAPRRRRRTA
jgi:hypothetical protein